MSIAIIEISEIAIAISPIDASRDRDRDLAIEIGEIAIAISPIEIAPIVIAPIAIAIAIEIAPIAISPSAQVSWVFSPRN